MFYDIILIFTVNIERKRHPFKCLTFGATNLADRQPATGDFDGNINVWDLENKMPGCYSVTDLLLIIDRQTNINEDKQ